MDTEILLSELKFKAIRSSGSGGQHVNKVSSKIELLFSLKDSLAFSEEEKLRLLYRMSNKLTSDQRVIMQCGETRSQHRNKELVIKRFLQYIQEHLVEDKKRVPTKIPKAVKKKRLIGKRLQSQKKANRKKPNID